MPLIPFGELAPDLTDLRSGTTQRAENVLPRADGYGPAKSLNPVTATLPGVCRGEYHAKKTDGTVVIFAATAERLFRLNNTDFTWVPVSKVAALTSISNGTPAVFTMTAHGLVANDSMVLSTAGTLPTGLTVGTVYYVKTVPTADTFTVSLTPGGAAINTTGAGSGAHSMTYFYTGVTSEDQWQFVQYGDTVLATQSNTVVQRFDLASSSAFANLAGSPPQAKYISIVLTFVVLSGLTSDPYAIAWCGNGLITTWTPGVSESDEQSFADGGAVRGVAGGQFGIICQAGALKRMVYVPGNALVFQFDRVSEDHGIMAPYSLTRAGDHFYFFGNQGFQRIGGTGYPEPIGKEKFDRTTLADLDTATLRVFIGASDPRATRVYWSYKSVNGATGLFDKIAVYDYALSRWSTLIVSGEYIASFTKPGLTLENLDTIGTLDSLPFSLDDVSVTALSALSAVSTSHALGFFDGANLEATLEAPEQGDESQRVQVSGLRPVSDATTIYCSISRRESLQGVRTQTAEVLVNRYGISNQRDVTTRYSRPRVRIPAGETWTYASGVEPLVTIVGNY